MSVHEGDDPRTEASGVGDGSGSGITATQTTPTPGGAAGTQQSQSTLPFLGTGPFNMPARTTTGPTTSFPPPRTAPSSAEREAAAGLANPNTTITLGMLQQLLLQNNEQLLAQLKQPDQKETRRQKAVDDWSRDATPQLVDSFVRQGFSKSEAEELARRQLASSSTAPNQSAPYTGRRKFEVKDVGTFDGDASQLHEWLSNLEALHDMRDEAPWREALFDVIPLCLKGAGKMWLNGLPRETRAQLVSSRSLAVWKYELKRAFFEDVQDLRHTADARTFDYEHEPVNTYFWSKVELMRRAYPARKDDISYDIIMGLPTSFQLLVRVDMSDTGKPPALEEVLSELRKIETKWRRADPIKRALKVPVSKSEPPTTAPYGASAPTAASSSAPAGQKSYTTVQSPPAPSKANTSAASPSTSSSTSMTSSRASYDPKNIFYSGGVRHYRHPADGRIMRLQYPCHCGEDEFNFEHGQPNRAPIKKPTAALVIDVVDGYPVFPPNSIDPDDMDVDSDDSHGNVDTPPTSPEVGTSKTSGRQKSKSSGGDKSART